MNAGKWLLPILLLAASNTMYAQYAEDEGGIELESGYLRYLGLGAGATYQVMNDPAVSPIIYSKIGALPMLSTMKLNGMTFSEVSMRASRLNLTHNADKDKLTTVKTRTQRALIDYRYMIKVSGDEMRNLDMRAGGILSGMFMHKYSPHMLDAAKVYEYAASLGITGRITKEITLWGKTSYLSWDLAMPVVTNMSRPLYLNREEVEDPENKVIQDFMNNSQTGTFGKYFRLDSRVSVFFRLDNGNGVQFAYEWDYSRMKTHQKIYFAEHLVSILFMFNY